MLSRQSLLALIAAFVMMTAAPTVFAQELSEMDPGTASIYGTVLAEQFAKKEGLQVKVDVDPQQAVGLVMESTGIILVPEKQLKDPEEGEVNPDVATEVGAGLGYLFMSPRFNPHFGEDEDKAEKLHSLEITGPEGDTTPATGLLLAARRLEGDDWRLYAYGSDEKPLIDVPFFPAEEAKEGTVRLHVQDVQDEKGTLVITLFGKYEASFPINHR